jgi:plasmid stability protein
MPDVLVRDMETAVIDRLKTLARAENRSLQAEMKSILNRGSLRRSKQAQLEAIRKIRDSIGPQTTDSADLLREDRSR